MFDIHDTNKMINSETIRSTGVYGKNLKIERIKAATKKKIRI